jgi:hypothetical protein
MEKNRESEWREIEKAKGIPKNKISKKYPEYTFVLK